MQLTATARHRLSSMLLWGAAAFVVLVVLAPPASALAIGVLPTAEGDTVYSGEGIGAMHVPFNRWSQSAGGLKWIGNLDVAGMIASVGRGGLQTVLLASGHALWGVIMWLMELAVGFSIMNQVGGAIDALAKQIADFATSSLLTAFALLVAIVVAFRQATRGGGTKAFLRVLSVAIMVGILGLMGTAAGNSTSSGEGENKVYTAAVGSPGWFVERTNAAIGGVASGLATVVDLNSVQQNSLYNRGDIAVSNMHCGNFMAGLNALQDSYGDEDGEAASQQFQQGKVIRLISGYWETTGVQSYKAAQFGNNQYADKVFCHALDQGAPISVDKHLQPFNKAPGNIAAGVTVMQFPGEDGKANESMVWAPDNGANWQAVMVAFAACNTTDGGKTWTVDQSWKDNYKKDGNALEDSDCMEFYKIGAGGNVSDKFDVEPGTSGVNKVIDGDTAPALAIKDYLSTIVGAEGAIGSGIVSAGTYAVSSLMVAVVFGGLALGTIIAKVFAAFFGLMLVVTLLGAMFRRDGWGQIGGAFFRLVGASVFASATVLVLTVIVMLSTLLSTLGSAIAAPGTFLSLIWVGFTPILAVMAMSYLFTKVFKLPNPLSIKGAQSWANAMAPAGAALAGGIAGHAIGQGQGGRGGDMIDSAQRMAEQQLGRGMRGASQGGKAEREGSMLSGHASGAGQVDGKKAADNAISDADLREEEAAQVGDMQGLADRVQNGSFLDRMRASREIKGLGNVETNADGANVLGASVPVPRDRSAAGVGAALLGGAAALGGKALGGAKALGGKAAGGARNGIATGVDSAHGRLSLLNTAKGREALARAKNVRKIQADLAKPRHARHIGVVERASMGGKALAGGTKSLYGKASNGALALQSGVALGRAKDRLSTVQRKATLGAKVAARNTRRAFSADGRQKMLDSVHGGAKALGAAATSDAAKRRYAAAGKVALRGGVGTAKFAGKTALRGAKTAGKVAVAGAVVGAVAASNGRLATPALALATAQTVKAKRKRQEGRVAKVEQRMQQRTELANQALDRGREISSLASDRAKEARKAAKEARKGSGKKKAAPQDSPRPDAARPMPSASSADSYDA